MSRKASLNLQRLESREVPASDLAYALQLTGLPASSVSRVVADPIGNVFVTGTFSGAVDLNPDPKVDTALTSHGGTDIFVAKYGNTGQLLWANQLGGAANESAADIALDGIANVYVGGTFAGAVDFNPATNVAAIATASTGGSAFVWKLAYNGNFLMARTVAGTSSIANIAVDARGSITATGQFSGTADFNPSPTLTANLTTANVNGASFLWRLDPAGTYAWANAFQSTGTIQTTAVVVDGPGNAYLAGRFTGTADLDPSDTARSAFAAGQNWMPFVVKLNSTGNHTWSKTLRIATPVVDAPNAINALGIDGMGNVYTAGVFAGTLDFDPGTPIVGMTSSSNLPDGFVWKLKNDGSFGYARRFGGVKAETVSDMVVDSSGRVFVTGTYTGVADFDPSPTTVANLISGAGVADTFVLKLTTAGNLGYTRSLGGGLSTTRSTGIFSDPAGNMYLAGTVFGTGDFDPGTPLYTIQGNSGSGFIAKLSLAPGTTVAPTNLPPTGISAGGPYVIDEGQGLTVKATGVDPEGKPLAFTWDLNGDGKYGDAIGWKVTLTPAQMAALGLADGTGIPRVVKVRISDAVNLPVVAASSLTINNVAPVAKIVIPATAVEGVRPQVSFKVPSETTPDRNAGFRASWDFNDDGVWDLGDGATYAGSVRGGQKIPLSFVSDSGPLAVHVRVFDKDGGYSDSTGTIVLQEQAPTGVFSMMSVPSVGNPVTFQFSSPNDAPDDRAAGFKYGFDFNNDGVFEIQGTKAQATTVFPSRGTYVVHGAIVDKDGTFNVYELVVNVMI